MKILSHSAFELALKQSSLFVWINSWNFPGTCIVTTTNNGSEKKNQQMAAIIKLSLVLISLFLLKIVSSTGTHLIEKIFSDNISASVRRIKITVWSRYPLDQACQTGGPQAACGPIVCLMWPAVTYLNQTFTWNCK